MVLLKKIMMKGFELEIKNKKILGYIKNGVTILVADIVDGKVKLSFEGTSFNKDKTLHENIKWFDSELEEGQEFTVRVKKIKNE